MCSFLRPYNGLDDPKTCNPFTEACAYPFIYFILHLYFPAPAKKQDQNDKVIPNIILKSNKTLLAFKFGQYIWK